MVSGYVSNGCFSDVIKLFCELKNYGRVKPNGFLFVSAVLIMCPLVGSFEDVNWIHSYIKENGLE